MKILLHRLLLFALTPLGIPPAQSQPLALDAPLPLPVSTRIPHYRLAVAYNSTTVLVFPAPVRPVDRGDRDVLAQKQPGAENVLKLKAGRRDFPPTNLHVFTADGRLYAFDITYTDSLAGTYDLTRLNPVLPPASGSPILLTGQALNADEMAAALTAIRTQHPNFSVATKRYRMRLHLDNIDRYGQLIFLHFSLANRSSLDYVPDFLRLYMVDRRRAKRTSHQELEVTPVYSDTLPTVPGEATGSFILAIPLMTIPDQREFRIELYEKNGGRSLSLTINNRQLLRSRTVPPQ